MSADATPSRALAVLAAMAVAVLVVAAAASPTLNAVVIGIGLGLGAVIGAVGVAAYQLTRHKAATALTTALAGAACTFVITWWLLRDDSERADSLLFTTIGGAILGLLCVLATLLVLRSDGPGSAGG